MCCRSSLDSTCLPSCSAEAPRTSQGDEGRRRRLHLLEAGVLEASNGPCSSHHLPQTPLLLLQSLLKARADSSSLALIEEGHSVRHRMAVHTGGGSKMCGTVSFSSSLYEPRFFFFVDVSLMHGLPAVGCKCGDAAHAGFCVELVAAHLKMQRACLPLQCLKEQRASEHEN